MLFIRYETWYEVCTHWGWFRLDEGAYGDYLEGRLWITWKPGRARSEPLPRSGAERRAANISEEALELRESAARLGVYTLLGQLAPGEQAVIPYKARMSALPIDELNLSVRSSNGLMRAGASDFGKLRELMERETGLRDVRNLGAKSEREIYRAFISACYGQLTPTEKALFWQEFIDSRAG